MFYNYISTNDLHTFAEKCGCVLDDYRFCENGIKISLMRKYGSTVVKNYPLVYILKDYCVEELDVLHSFGSKETLPDIQKKWRQLLKHKFGKNYVKHFNSWLDEQKLSY